MPAQMPDPDPAHPRPFVAVQMAALVVETLLYGIFLVLFFAICYLRLSTQEKGKSRFADSVPWRTSVEVSLLAILTLATTHWIITIFCTFSAFLGDGDDTLGAVVTALFTRLELFVIAADTLTVFSMLVGDAVLIHRTWVIWNRNIRVALLPISLWIGMMVSGLGAVGLLYHGSPGSLHAPYNWVFANFILSTITSMYCTTFMAWRIWKACRESAELRAKNIMSVLTVLVESAAIWTSWTIAFVALHGAGSLAELSLNAGIPSLIGIVNTVIHLRVAVGLGPRHQAGHPRGTGTVGPTTQNDTRIQELPMLTTDASVFGHP
ncbi:hypothetical protein MVEN_02177200 [Mycena venus]|uniref:Uncharacterized protein n=1 Tax=Mycena venus TaxID=2733690 RepID=A0A8H6X983_9AGAR|nr:hypothetical protein MVEN_02177200 [Mycena venus]